MSPFLLVSALLLGTSAIVWQVKHANALLFLKVSTLLAVLAGVAYAPQASFLLPGAFSGFFGNTNTVRALSTLLVLVALFARRLPPIPYRHKAVVILCAFPVYMALMSLATGDPIFTKGVLGFTLRISDVICFFSIGYWISLYGRKFELSEFMSWIAALTVLLSIAAMVSEPAAALRGERFRGVSFSANWSGMYFALMVVPVFSLLALKTHLMVKTAGALLFIALLTFLAATGSRGSVVAALMGLATFSLLSQKNFLATVGLGALSLAALIFLPSKYSTLNSQILVDRFENVENTRASVWQLRWDQWIDSGDLWVGTLDASFAVESQALSILFVYGILGTLIAAVCLIAFLNEIRKARRGRPGAASNVAISLIAVFFTTCLFETPYFGIISAFNIILYLAVGAIFGDKARRRQLELG